MLLQRGSDVVIMQEKTMSDDYETGLFECDVSDGNMNCVVKPVFHNCNITFTSGK